MDGVWYWSKFYNGNGFYRFEDSDILATATAGGEPAPAAGIALAGMWPKSFAYDATDGSFYFSIMDTPDMLPEVLILYAVQFQFCCGLSCRLQN